MEPAALKSTGKMMVKIDQRHGYIRWLRDRQQQPRRLLLAIRDDKIRAAAEAAFKEEDDAHDRVLAQFNRCGYAYVQVDVLDEDDPTASLSDHQCVEAEEVVLSNL